MVNYLRTRGHDINKYGLKRLLLNYQSHQRFEGYLRRTQANAMRVGWGGTQKQVLEYILGEQYDASSDAGAFSAAFGVPTPTKQSEEPSKKIYASKEEYLADKKSKDS